jgi:hypothetical protein
MKELRNVLKMSENPQQKISLRRLSHIREDNDQMGLKEMGYEHVLG